MRADAPAGAARFGARALLAAAALVLVAVPFGLLLLLVKSGWGPLLEVDEGARDGLHRIALGSDGFVLAMKVVSAVANTPGYTVLLAAVAVWLVRDGLRRLAVFAAVTVAGGALLNWAVKAAVDRARPVLENPVAEASGLSFPSGHAQSAIVVAGVLLLVFGGGRRGIAAATAFVLLVGFSRVALGVHFVSDVVAGYVLGAAWVAAMAAAFRAWRREDATPAAPATARTARPGP